MLRHRLPGVAAVAALALTGELRAEEPAESDAAEQRRIEAWLATKPASADVSVAPAAPEAPPPPPRRHGFIVESTVGATGHLGGLRHVSPTEPWIRGAFGWEPTRWLMLVLQGDVAFGSTEYANPPPEPRGFALVAMSVGLRFGVQPWDSVAFFAQGEIGGAQATEDVLASYGFTDADQLGPYFGAALGVEWYQVSPHLALAVHAGVRNYAQILDRTISSESSLAWTTSLGPKYTF